MIGVSAGIMYDNGDIHVWTFIMPIWVSLWGVLVFFDMFVYMFLVVFWPFSLPLRLFNQ